MSDTQQQFGRQSELLAAKFLVKQGYKILASNYSTPAGEIDIIAKEKDVIVFVEVKARRSDRYGSPERAITKTKQRKISMAALHYLKDRHLVNVKARFDVIAIRMYKADNVKRDLEITILKNAFELAYQ